MTVREGRLEEARREYKAYTEPGERQPRALPGETPVVAERLTAERLTEKPSFFSRLVDRGNRLVDHGISALDLATSSLQKARGAAVSFQKTTFSASATSHEVTTGPSKLPAAPVFEHKSAENHDRETAVLSPHINITLFQVNVNNEKGPGIASQVVNTVAGAMGSLASARHFQQEETKSDTPPKASSIGARAMGLGLSALKLGARTFKKHVLE